VTDDPTAHTRLLLQRINAGDAEAVEQLLPYIYDELHGLARRIMAGERHEHTLQPTALINEAFLRLIDQSAPGIQDRVHFVRVAARAMRNVLVDHARARSAAKRGGGNLKVTLDEGLVLEDGDSDSLLHVHETLERLSAVDPQLGQIVELRFFGGLKDAEIGAAIGVSERTVQRGWRMARAWLSREMTNDRDRPDAD
jgi:RNA polymerase sigma factor (TIGR02999 family)